MRKTTLIAVLCGLLFPCSQTNTAFTFAPSPSPESPPKAAGTPAPGFTICQGTFALCTSAKCTGQRTQTGLKVKCSCDVKQAAYSVGTKPCSDVPQAPPTPGQLIPSRYSPITSTAVCPSNGVWAFCLDKKCTVDQNTAKATCECTLLRSPQRYVVVAGTARVTLDGVETTVTTGGVVDIPVGAAHRIENVGSEKLVFIEIQLGTYLGEDDIQRLQDDYGRSG